MELVNPFTDPEDEICGALRRVDTACESLLCYLAPHEHPWHYDDYFKAWWSESPPVAATEPERCPTCWYPGGEPEPVRCPDCGH